MKNLLTCCMWTAAALFLTCGCVSRHTTLAYPYTEPLISPGAQLSGLPPAVQKTIRAQTGTADIREIRKLQPLGESIYRVTFRAPDMFPPLYIHTDGSVLNPDLSLAVGAVSDVFGATSGGAASGIRFGDLPIKVARAIQEKAPTTEVGYITTVTVNDQVFYQVSFREAQPQLLIREDGVIVDQLPSADELPVPPPAPRSPPGITVQ